MLRCLCIIFLLITLNSCNNTTQWTSFNGTGLRSSNEHFTKMLFLNEETGFIVGSYTSNETFHKREYLQNSEAILYKTIDGGLSWKRKVIGKGQVQDLFILRSSIYLVLDSFLTSSYEKVVKKFYQSTDYGGSWQEVINASTVQESLIKCSSKRICESRDTLFILYDYLYAIDLLTGKSEDIKLPGQFRPAQLKANENEIWILGEENGKTVLLKRKAGESFKKIDINIKNCSPQLCEFNAQGDTISIIDGEINGKEFKYNFFYSTDLGVTWVKEDLVRPYYASPSSFINNKFIAYSGAGEFQVRK